MCFDETIRKCFDKVKLVEEICVNSLPRVHKRFHPETDVLFVTYSKHLPMNNNRNR